MRSLFSISYENVSRKTNLGTRTLPALLPRYAQQPLPEKNLLTTNKNKPKKPRRFDKHCTHCGCVLSAKTSCLSCACPIEKWGAEMESREEEEQLIQTVYGKQGSEDTKDSTGQAD